MKAVEALKEQDRVDDNFQTHMEAAFPGSYAPIYDNKLWTLAVHLLEVAMEDRGGTVGWWVYETDYGKEHAEVSWTENGKEKSVTLDSAEVLYDYLKECAEGQHVADMKD